jgi:hypothetical protein
VPVLGGKYRFEFWEIALNELIIKNEASREIRLDMGKIGCEQEKIGHSASAMVYPAPKI